MAEHKAPTVEAATPNSVHTGTDPPGGDTPPRPRRTPLYELYRQPVPLRTFPLPTFYPANPLSLLHVAFVWIQQAVFPPPPEPAVIYTGIWSEETRSVHVLDRRDMEALWYNGFFGKGSLSRSEPTWKKRMMIERSMASGAAAEHIRGKRRDDRSTFKWERARLEQLAIESARLAEGKSLDNGAMPTVSEHPQESTLSEESSPRANSGPDGATTGSVGGRVNGSAASSIQSPASLLTPPASPVTPLALLRLPNSVLDYNYRDANKASGSLANGSPVREQPRSPILPISMEDVANAPGKPSHLPEVSLVSSAAGHADDAHSANGDSSLKVLKRQKSVRFSPTVESTTFRRTDPPSPNHSPPIKPKYPASQAGSLSPVEDLTPPLPVKHEDAPSRNDVVDVEPPDILDREHLQLSMEEAFFLTFGVGTLSVTNPADGSRLSNEDLFTLFRRLSRIPPQIPDSSAGLSQDDPFRLRYAVYHRYRSLGWVVRDGIKFGVDLLLYLKGPVFSHAEFALVIMPPDGCRSWHWLHAVNRALAAVFKSLVLVYVDTPPGGVSEVGEGGVAGMLQQYRIREVPVKRWSSNRNR